MIDDNYGCHVMAKAHMTDELFIDIHVVRLQNI